MRFLILVCGGLMNSIWTVDLAHLLRHFAVDVAFLIVTIGANPNFAVEIIYKVSLLQDPSKSC